LVLGGGTKGGGREMSSPLRRHHAKKKVLYIVRLKEDGRGADEKGNL